MCIHKADLRLAVVAMTLAVLLMLTVFEPQAAQAVTFNVIYNFTGSTDGTSPYAGLTMDSTGNLYGTTLSGGTGYGTVYKLTKTGSAWTFATLYKFAGGNDGANPRSKILLGPDGSLYGETFAGGGSACSGRGCGTIFRLHKNCPICGLTESVLYRFTGGTDGAEPVGDLLLDSSGSLYGTTEIGGKPHSCGNPGCGTVFKLTSLGGVWTQTVLYQFQGGTDGAYPSGGVISDASGNLYGSTCCGTSSNAGTVFQLTPQGGGWSERILYAFHGTTDGKEPATGLMFDRSGNLYGTTIFGGSGQGGTVFELVPSGGNWTLSVLYSLRGGVGPYGTLNMDPSGSIYGTTFQDGTHLLGSAFKLTPSGGSWTYSSFHDFTEGLDGGFPVSNLMFASSGKVYATAALGGTHGYGVVVEITP